MSKYQADLIHVRGWNDRMAGKPVESNPYLLTSVKNHGLQKQSLVEIWMDGCRRDTTQRGGTMNGTRLNEDWLPDPSLRAWAVGRRPDLDMTDTIEQFKDYWLAKTGKDATKLCWNRTFRNWVRSARVNTANRQPIWQREMAPRPPSHSPAKPALDRLPDDKRRENLERLSSMFDSLFQKVT